MPIGTYTMLKGTKPAFEEKSSANYYAYGPSGSVATYKKISGLITLPDKVRLVGTGKGRNAFISWRYCQGRQERHRYWPEKPRTGLPE